MIYLFVRTKTGSVELRTCCRLSNRYCSLRAHLLGHAVNYESKSDNKLYEEPTYVLDKTYRIGTYQIGSLARYPVLNLITGRISDQGTYRMLYPAG